MEKEFIVACFITFLFAVMVFIEYRVAAKEMPPLKFVVGDAIKVFIASLMGVFIFSKLNGSITEFMNTITNTAPSLDASFAPIIFTDEPGF
jgi:hypothetical protein